jgi:hypothetical protein
VSKFTLDVAKQIANAATGQRKRPPFATNEEVLFFLQEAEAAHDEAVSDFEDVNEDSRQKQLLLDFAPAVRKLISLWGELRPSGRRTIMSYCSDACPEDDAVRRRLENSDMGSLEKELLLEFLPAFTEASLHPRVRRARDAARAIPDQNTVCEDVCVDEFEEVMEGRLLRLIRPSNDRWKIYDIALKRLKEGAALAKDELEGRGGGCPRRLVGLEAFTRVIGEAWAVKPKDPGFAEFSSKFGYETQASGNSEYSAKSPAAKFLWVASQYLRPPYLGGDFLPDRTYTVQNCETVMDYVTGALRGEKLAANS